MHTFKKLQKKCVTFGVIKGESAKQFYKRDSKSSKKLAQFIDTNHAALVNALSNIA